MVPRGLNNLLKLHEYRQKAPHKWTEKFTYLFKGSFGFTLNEEMAKPSATLIEPLYGDFAVFDEYRLQVLEFGPFFYFGGSSKF